MLRVLLLLTIAAASTARAQMAPGVTELDRAPTAADTGDFYQQDQLWLDPRGQTWAMRSFGKAAVWRALDPTARVVDEVGGAAPAAAYGTMRLTAQYRGSALRIVNSVTGASQDVGFLPDGSLDEAALAGFCAGADCRVAKWYDQSGNGNDASQPDASARPVVRLAHRTGRALSIVWDYEATAGGPVRSLVLPSSLAVDSGNMAVLWTGRFHSAALISPLVELGTDPEAFNFGFWDAHADFYLGTQNHLSELPGHASLSASVGLISSSPQEGIVTNYRNQVRAQGKLPPEPHRGGLIGQTRTYKAAGMIELSSLIVYARGLPASERFRSVQALTENFAIPQQQGEVYVADGDSLTQGIAAPFLQSYAWDLERLLPRSALIYDAGWAAKTLGGGDGLLNRFADFTAKLFTPGARHNIISLFAGTNDLQNGTDDKELMRLVRSYATVARKTGFRIVVTTIIPRASLSAKAEGYRLAFNAALRSQWRDFADGLVDLATEPGLNAPKMLTDTTIYAEDGVHLTDFGYQLVAAAFSRCVAGLLN